MADNTLYVKLKDKGTSFYDAGQSAGVAGPKIGKLAMTPKVAKAIKDNILERYDSDTAEEEFDKQEADYAQAKLDAQSRTMVTVNVAAPVVNVPAPEAAKVADTGPGGNTPPSGPAPDMNSNGGDAGSGAGDDAGDTGKGAKKDTPKLDI